MNPATIAIGELATTLAMIYLVAGILTSIGASRKKGKKP